MSQSDSSSDSGEEPMWMWVKSIEVLKREGASDVTVIQESDESKQGAYFIIATIPKSMLDKLVTVGSDNVVDFVPPDRDYVSRQ